MSLSDLIKGTSRPEAFATATHATFATDEQVENPSVATVATVNVATTLANCKTDKFSDEDEKLVRCWLASIGETDQSLINRTIRFCRTDARSREFFLAQSLKFREQAAILGEEMTWER
jgi:hypothetical protein